MSSKDTLLHSLSTSGTSAEPNIFQKKAHLSILDQNTSYQSGQSRINLSSISNSTYIDMKNAYLSIPLCITMTGAISPETAATSLDYSVGLIPFNHNIIHNMSVSVNGNLVKQQTNFENIFHTFRLMSLLSMNELSTLGHIGFSPDDLKSVRWSGAAHPNGNGSSRNKTAGAFDVVNGANSVYASYNSGFVSRIKGINYNSDGVIGSSSEKYSTLLADSKVNQLRRSRVYKSFNRTTDDNSVDGVRQLQVDMCVPLKTFSLFENMPLIKGTNFEFLINYNQVAFDVVKTSSGLSCGNTNIAHALNGTNPLMFSSADSNEPNAVLPNKTFRVSCAVGNKCLDTQQITNGASNIQNSTLAQQVSLELDSYAFTPEIESSYIAEPVKKIVYKDIQHYQLSNVASDAAFNHLITSGTSNLCSLLIVPQFTAEGNCNPSLTPTLSPFDGSVYPSPLAMIGNYNVRVAGENLYNEDMKYDKSVFLQEILGSRSVNSSLTHGLASGMIGLTDWELAPYFYSTLSRGDAISKGVPKSVQIQGTNLSSKAVSYHIFLEYERELNFDVLTGQVMM